MICLHMTPLLNSMLHRHPTLHNHPPTRPHHLARHHIQYIPLGHPSLNPVPCHPTLNPLPSQPPWTLHFQLPPACIAVTQLHYRLTHPRLHLSQTRPHPVLACTLLTCTSLTTQTNANCQFVIWHLVHGSWQGGPNYNRSSPTKKRWCTTSKTCVISLPCTHCGRCRKNCVHLMGVMMHIIVVQCVMSTS